MTTFSAMIPSAIVARSQATEDELDDHRRVRGGERRDGARSAPPRRRLLRRDGHDLALAPRDQDVVVLVERVVLLGRKRSPVGLDEPAVLAEGLEGVANPGSVGGARTLDGERDQVHRIVRVGRTY